MAVQYSILEHGSRSAPEAQSHCDRPSGDHTRRNARLSESASGVPLISSSSEKMQLNHVSDSMLSRREAKQTADGAHNWHRIGMCCRISLVSFHCIASRFSRVCYRFIGGAAPSLITYRCASYSAESNLHRSTNWRMAVRVNVLALLCQYCLSSSARWSPQQG